MNSMLTCKVFYFSEDSEIAGEFGRKTLRCFFILKTFKRLISFMTNPAAMFNDNCINPKARPTCTRI